MAKLFYDGDADIGRLKGRPIAVIGYGSQGHAHALGLQDSGLDVRVGLAPKSASRARAEAEGLRVLDVDRAAAEAELIMLLVPDTAQAEVFENHIAHSMGEGKTLLFAHGFNIRYGQIRPPAGVDVSMVAPKAPGHRVRELFREGKGVPALIAVHQDASGHAQDDALAYASGIGCTRAGVLLTTFAEETETDLFGEQAVLCGGVTQLIKAGFETLVAAGYQPEVAYFECLHELKLIVDLIHQGGLSYMRYSVSDTAEYGDYTAGPRVVGSESRAAMHVLLADIKSGAFARRWIAENRTGRHEFERMRAGDVDHQIETVGRTLRGMMPFLDPKEILPGAVTPESGAATPEPALV